jgi:hypothetical protein
MVAASSVYVVSNVRLAAIQPVIEAPQTDG